MYLVSRCSKMLCDYFDVTTDQNLHRSAFTNEFYPSFLSFHSYWGLSRVLLLNSSSKFPTITNKYFQLSSVSYHWLIISHFQYIFGSLLENIQVTSVIYCGTTTLPKFSGITTTEKHHLICSRFCELVCQVLARKASPSSGGCSLVWTNQNGFLHTPGPSAEL